MSEKLKNYACLFFAILFLPLAIGFFIEICGRRVLDLIALEDVIYFDWRSLPMLSVMPISMYIEFMLISCLFTKNGKAHPKILRGLRYMTVFTAFFFVPSFILSPIVSVGLAFSSYHSCPTSSVFSGVYYVKYDFKCLELTNKHPWKKL